MSSFFVFWNLTPDFFKASKVIFDNHTYHVSTTLNKKVYNTLNMEFFRIHLDIICIR